MWRAMKRLTLRHPTLRDHLPMLTLLISLTVVFVIRCCIAAGHLDMGCDIATYLATTNAFFGQDPTGFGLDRPPLIALPVKVFALVFGDLNGVKLLGILLSVAIGIPFYLIAKRISHPWIAVAMTIVFVLTPAYSDMLTWGYITMFGMMFGLPDLALLPPGTRHSRRRPTSFLTGLFASFIVGFHQLSLAFFVPLFFLLVGALFAFDRRETLHATSGHWRLPVLSLCFCRSRTCPCISECSAWKHPRVRKHPSHSHPSSCRGSSWHCTLTPACCPCTEMDMCNATGESPSW